MTYESLLILRKDVAFGKLPPEQMNPVIEKSLKRLSIETGEWFENTVETNLKTINFQEILNSRALCSLEQQPF